MNRFIIATLAVLMSAVAAASDEYRMIVRIKPGCTVLDAQEAATSLGGTLVDVTPNAPFGLISLPNDPWTLTLAQLQLAFGWVDVVWQGDDATLWSAESVSRGSTISVISRGSTISVIGDRTDVAEYNSDYSLQTNWRSALAAEDGRTVRVAILDNGLSRLQTALWSKVDAYYDAFGGNADDRPMNRDSNGNGHPDDGVGHGTMVAGLIDAAAPKVRFVVAKVADSDGRASAWGMVKALAFAVASGAEVANVSLGAEEEVPAFSNAAAWAKTQGLLVVAAIGNAGADHAWYPSRDSGTLCVAGVGADSVKWQYSNYDACAVVCAPSENLVSQFWDGTLASWSGTSFAAPQVAAAIADSLRRTTPKSAEFLIGCALASGSGVDTANPAAYRGKIGRLLDFVGLDAKVRQLNP